MTHLKYSAISHQNCTACSGESSSCHLFSDFYQTVISWHSCVCV